MADVTPSPAADGPFTLASEHTLADGSTTEKRPIHITNLRLLQLSNEGKTLKEIAEILYNEEIASYTAGPSPNA
jgi:hypothetical protein